ncbi:hypothetical protein KAI87_01580 [Myxococcota bacterium]|nr:hypothetical protein [Myxococcota bacterium]
MMIYKLTSDAGEVLVRLNTTDPESTVILEFEGPEDAIEAVQYDVEMSDGAFGHQLGDATTPIDLHAAMLSERLAHFSPELIEGKDIVTNYGAGSDHS